MQTVDLELTKLKPYPKNAKKHPAEQVKIVAESIQQFGWAQPIVVDEDYEILIGHGRLKAAQLLKLKTAPCLILRGLTDEQKRKLRLIDNKSNESEWDYELLAEELPELDFSDFPEIDWGIEQTDEFTDIIEDEAPEVNEESEPITKLGDVWALGEHRLVCGDSTKQEDVDKLMGGEKADMILSDPPYGMHLDTDFSGAIGSLGSLGRKGHTRGNKYDKVIGDNDDFSPELISTFFNNFNYCKEIFLFGADYFAELLPNKNTGSWLCWDKRKESQADAIGSEFELIWSKSKHKRRMLRHDWFGFLSSENAKDAQHRVHPTQKPISLLIDIITQWGNKCDIIVDLYGGSGSTLIACEQLNRKCFTMELDPKYCDVIIKRWENLTGNKAKKIN